MWIIKNTNKRYNVNDSEMINDAKIKYTKISFGQRFVDYLGLNINTIKLIKI